MANMTPTGQSVEQISTTDRNEFFVTETNPDVWLYNDPEADCEVQLHSGAFPNNR